MLARVYCVLGLLGVSTAAASLLIGSGDLADSRLAPVFLELRALRFGAAFAAGAALAVGGVVVQGLFRNPLADPSILGTTAGANLGGRVVLLAYESVGAGTWAAWLAPELLLPVGCVLGAVAALAILLAVQRAGDDTIVLLLTGFLLSSLFASLGGLVISLAQERFELARAMLTFALGDVTGVGGQRLVLVLPMLLVGLLAVAGWARSLDLLLSGEEEAASLGLDLGTARFACILWTAVLTAVAVALAGSIGFVGLIVPHALRRFVGAAHPRLIPVCALAGGTFVVVCDVIARVLPAQTEVPLGVVTGLIGAPVFLTMLLRTRREVAHGF